MIDIGYSLSRRFPDPPQTDYRRADVRALRHDLFCGDIYIAGPKADLAKAGLTKADLPKAGSGAPAGRLGAEGELSTRWGWVPVLDFGWALCDIVEQLDRGPLGSRAAGPRHAQLDFTESTDLLRFERRFGWVDVTADWAPDDPPLSFNHAELRREARDFLHDLIADLADMHEGLADNPVLWDLSARFPRVRAAGT